MLQNKKIVIIGGTTGIGLSAAKAFVRFGAGVILVGRNPESCRKAKDIVGQAGDVLIGDAMESLTSTKAIDLCISTFGGFDGLYHVAGGSGRRFGDGPLHELSVEGWNKTFELNLTSLMLSNQAAIRKFRELGMGGTILNMSSVLGFSPSPNYFVTHAYAAAKSAVIGFTKSIAAYYAFDNIRVNLLAPALVETPMSERASKDEIILNFVKTKQPLDGGRNGRPEDLDGAAVYFMSDGSRFTTGQTLYVDGGWEVSEGQYQNNAPV
ncbi:SDR family NAD(P)-dependent oxidoreductase [Runella slithyformis]|uniref:3-oxoacyl-(Acyl-carrier-protein) reductase n=1 Tax=Runella slithyformis (strain ATCC 29530 / DSM 19594 / LMG 11500 / NCIMB 11436 / LSU 4) TaxID=761193 RepID=A0A7U3ZPN2_RUNSL|nr:SDR family oxidoreductase [Runella slithyformis]AEI51060.1 3-oxoacyl-(acyl-carrier-protein) reductase [Runella slithyformis DSM 19594]